MKRLLSIFLAANFAILAFGQIEEKMQKEGVVTGVIIKKGVEIPGYIRKEAKISQNGRIYGTPWSYQGGIKFIPKEVFETTEKIKNKNYESYSPKDLEGFRYDNDSLVYETVKYSDASSLGVGTIPKLIFMRKLADGKISLYAHFSEPPKVMVGTPEDFEQEYINCNTPHFVYRKGADGKLKLVSLMNIEKELADCPYVVEKHANGEYNIVGKKNTKFNRFLNSSDDLREDIRLTVIEDYNNNCE